ncbi:hypothetical protein [Aquipuribacter hungaricus]|uniref:DUF4340 domain-containing protein n=3 Tax=Aquipuribacter hungaricus TaxID=545624 RepID=A0ABV7WMJ3_9MICO
MGVGVGVGAGRGRRWLAVGLPVALLLGVLVTASLRPAVQGCPGGPSVVLLPAPDEVPDLVGLEAAAARAAAGRAGVAWAAREERWVVDRAARGTVLRQAGGGCGDPLELDLSTGGPLVDPADLAPAARNALGPDPGLVRLVRLDDGVAIQGDRVVTGECAAVYRLVEEEELDDALEVSCYAAPAAALVTAVRDGSGFLGPPGDDVRVLQSSSGARGEGEAVGWTADRALDGWRLTVLVGSGRGVDDLRCGPASAYEVCSVETTGDGTQVATAQVLGERPPGTSYISLEAVTHRSPWRVRVVLAPDVEGSAVPARPTRPPAGLPDLVRLAEEARAAVEPVAPPP